MAPTEPLGPAQSHDSEESRGGAASQRHHGSIAGTWLAGLLGPILMGILWMMAHSFAAEHGAPEGDTTFLWLPLSTWYFAVSVWGANVMILVLLTYARAVHLLIPFPIPELLLTVTAAAQLMMTFGLVGFLTVGKSEGFPSDPAALTVLAVAALASGLPTLMMWWASIRSNR